MDNIDRIACAVTAASFLLLMAGCQPARDRSANGPERTLSAPSIRLGGLDQHLSEGMAYSDVRRLVFEDGWAPVVDPDCTENVVGSDYKSACSAHPELDGCSICKNLPELSGCSGDAYCGMYFSKGPRRLHIVAFGDMRDWNVGGDRSGFSVTGWDFAGIK